jgi:hypothetical protein
MKGALMPRESYYKYERSIDAKRDLGVVNK